MSAIVSSVLPVALIILIGFIAKRTLPLEAATLSQLTLYVLSPALIVDSLYRTSLSPGSTTGLLTGFTIISIILYWVVKGISKILKLPLSLQKSLLSTTLLPNNGNLGLPFIAFSFGTDGLERAVIYMIGSSILMFCFAPAILMQKGIQFGVKRTLKLPLVWSIVVGLGLRLLPVKIPFKLDLGIQQVGQAAIPLALILLGMELATTRFNLGVQELLASSLRLLLAPSIAYGVSRVLNLDILDSQVLVLQSAMPTAISTLVLVTEFGGDAAWVARTIVVSTLISFITLPFTLWLLT